MYRILFNLNYTITIYAYFDAPSYFLKIIPPIQNNADRSLYYIYRLVIHTIGHLTNLFSHKN